MHMFRDIQSEMYPGPKGFFKLFLRERESKPRHVEPLVSWLDRHFDVYVVLTVDNTLDVI